MRFPILQRRIQFSRTPPHELRPAWIIGYELLRFAVCIAFIAGLVWIIGQI